MTTPAVSPLLLDDATLDAGLALVSAGSGLPRRITGAVDYEARVMALNPTSYWPMNETGGKFLDRCAPARHLTYNVALGGVRGFAGPGPGGDAGAALWRNLYYSGDVSCAADHPEHQIVLGVPFTVMGWILLAAPSPGAIPVDNSYTQLISTRYSSIGAGWAFSLCDYAASAYGQVVSLTARNGGQCSVHVSLPVGVWTPVVWVHDGGNFNVWGNHRAYVGGVKATSASVGATSPTLSLIPNGGPLRVATSFSAVQVGVGVAHLALWNGVAITEEQALGLSNVGCGRATWDVAASSDARTVRRVWPVGANLREHDAAGESRSSRLYLQIGSDPEVEIEPGEDEGVTLPAGSTATVSVALTHLAARKLPFLGDSLGTEGAVAVIDGPDPIAPPQYVAAFGPTPEVGVVVAANNLLQPLEVSAVAVSPVAVDTLLVDVKGE